MARMRGFGGMSRIGEIMQARRVERLEAEVQALSEQVAKLLSGPTEERLLTSAEVMGFVGVTHPKTVERWAREKDMPCVRMGRNLRFRLGDVLRWRAQRES